MEAFHRQVQQTELQDRYELAASMLEEGYALFQGAQRASLRKDLRIWQGDVQKIAAQWEQVQAALAVLKQNNNDPQANLTVGRWYCFWNGKPAVGWPYLAKGSDEVLRRLAEQELSDAAGAEAEAHMGDAWLALGRSRYGDERMRNAGAGQLLVSADAGCGTAAGRQSAVPRSDWKKSPASAGRWERTRPRGGRPMGCGCTCGRADCACRGRCGWI